MRLRRRLVSWLAFLAMLCYGFVIDAPGLTLALVMFGAGNVALGAYAILNRQARRL